MAQLTRTINSPFCSAPCSSPRDQNSGSHGVLLRRSRCTGAGTQSLHLRCKGLQFDVKFLKWSSQN